MRRLQTYAAVSSYLFLQACATGPQPSPGPISAVVHTETQVVKQAVPVLCVDKIPEPRLPLTSARAIRMSGSGYQVVMKYDRELALRDSYEADLKAALVGCLKATASPQTGSPGGSGPRK